MQDKTNTMEGRRNIALVCNTMRISKLTGTIPFVTLIIDTLQVFTIILESKSKIIAYILTNRHDMHVMEKMRRSDKINS